MRAAVVAIPVVVSVLAAFVAGAPEFARGTPADMVSPGEPGEWLEIRGRVLGVDGRTPQGDVELFVLQTDGRELDHRTEGGADRPSGAAVTGQNGSYRIRTIRPAEGPVRDRAASIHFVVTAPGSSRRHWELLCADDPAALVRQRRTEVRGRRFAVRPLERRRDGILRCRFDITLG